MSIKTQIITNFFLQNLHENEINYFNNDIDIDVKYNIRYVSQSSHILISM